MRKFPDSTTNKNVPHGTFLVYEYSQCSGEIVTTIFAEPDGSLWRVTDWVNDKPHRINIIDASRDMVTHPINIYARICDYFLSNAAH